MNLTLSGYEAPEILRACSAFLLDLARISEDTKAANAYQAKQASVVEKDTLQEEQKPPGRIRRAPKPEPEVQEKSEPTTAVADAPFEEGQEVQASQDVEAPKLEEVRALLLKLQEAGHAEKCKALVQGQGVKSLSELRDNPAKLTELKARIEKELA